MWKCGLGEFFQSSQQRWEHGSGNLVKFTRVFGMVSLSDGVQARLPKWHILWPVLMPLLSQEVCDTRRFV